MTGFDGAWALRESTGKHDTASAFADEDLRELMRDMEERFAATIERMEWQRQHFHNLPGADPVIAKPYEACQKYQNTAGQVVHGKLRARLMENPVQVEAGNAAGRMAQEKAAQDLGVVLNSIIEYNNDRQGTNIQAALATGCIVDKYGVLHWGRAGDIYPEIPEREYLDILPDSDHDRYEPNTYGGEGDRKGKKYREKMGAYKDRVKRDRACAGIPYYIETIDPSCFRYIEDRSLSNGFGIGAVVRTVSRLSYVAKLQSERASADDVPALAMSEGEDEIPVYGEQDAPHDYLPSAAGWGKRVTIWQIWTRDEHYEIVTDDAGSWRSGGVNFQVLKSGKHLWGMAPFALAPGVVTESPDPALNCEPALEGWYRIKPQWDRLVTLYGLMAENIAMPLFYYKRTTDGRPYLSEDGKSQQYLSRDQAVAGEAPPGTELAKVDFSMNPAFQAFVEWLSAELQGALPDTGMAEITASTQPWAIRLQQAQASVVPGMLLQNIANAVQICMRSIAGDMSLKPEDGGLAVPVAVFRRVKDGKIDYSTTVSVEPEDIKSIDIRVTSDNTSSPEKVTLAQLGMSMLSAPVGGKPVGVITRTDFYRDFMRDPQPVDRELAKLADELAQQYIIPAVQRSALAKIAGSQIVMGPDGSFVGLGGQPMGSQQVIEQAAAGGNSRAAAALAGMRPQGTQGDLSGLQVPGTTAIPGMAG